MTQNASQRDFAVQIVQQLRDAGYEAYWAGGCVRDQLLGLEPKDYDVATSARPDQIRQLFGKRRTLSIGAAFGVISVLGGPSCAPIEVATFRADGTYLDGRHPAEIEYTNAEQDAERRDFTINGLFYDPLERQVIDYVSGEQDLRSGIVRAIGDPPARFTEDKLRMLRAVRFAATFGFQIEVGTMAAIRAMAAEVKVVSAERIGMEMRRMLVHEERSRAVRLLKEVELLSYVVPGMTGLDDARFDETLKILQRLSSPSLPLALAALVYKLDDASLGKRLAQELRFTNKQGQLAQWLLANVGAIGAAEQAPWPVLQRLLVHPGAHELVELHEAIVGGEDAGSAFCRAKLQLPAETLDPPPLVDGSDLIEHGIQPGPQFAELLERLRDAQLTGEITDRRQALDLVDHWLNESGNSP